MQNSAAADRSDKTSSPKSISLLFPYDSDSSAGLHHRVLDLIDALDALQLTRGSQYVAFIDTLLAHDFLVHLAVLDEKQRNTVENLLHPLRPLLPERHHYVEADQRHDQQKGVRKRIVLGDHRLLNGFADDQEQYEVECRYLRNRPVSPQAEDEEKHEIDHGRAND